MATKTKAGPTKYEISINGKAATVVEDTYLLKAVMDAGFNVPTLCNHKDLTPEGTCRLCLCEVEINGKKKLVTACNYPIRGEIKVNTNTEKIKKHRKNLAEMYLGRWPNVEAIQNIAKLCGATDKEKYKSDITDENPKACILCGHCVRACSSFVLQNILGFAGRGITRHLTMPFGETDPHCIECTSCGYVCPTGAIQVTDDMNNPADPELIRRHGMRINAMMAMLDDEQNRMRQVGTANLVEVMDSYDLLPVHNYKFGRHKDTPKIDSGVMKSRYFTQGAADGCWVGCSMACAKAVDGFELKTGPYKGQKVVVDGPEYETAAGGSNMGGFDLDFIVEFNFYCDTYGVDTISFATTMAFVMECFEAGIISEEQTGGKKLNFGAMNEALECLHEMALGEGFGVDVGQGIRRLKEKWANELGADPGFLNDIGMEVKGLEFSEYVTKESPAQQAGYALAIKGPQHDEALLIFFDAINNQIPTYEDKAEALYYFPLFRTWFGLLGLCKLIWNDVVPPDNSKYPPNEATKIPERVEDFQKFYEGMLGEPLDEKKMLRQSERVFNLQRLISYYLGYGTRADDMPPLRAIGPATEEEYLSREERYDKQMKEEIGIDPEGKTTGEKLAITREFRYKRYNELIDAVYKKRGWDNNGVPTVEHLKEIGIDIPEVLTLLDKPNI